VSKQLTGTWEWASRTFNIHFGCRHQCRYCYAGAMAACFRNVNPKDWSKEVLVENMFTKRFRKGDYMVMYPSAHDIMPEDIDEHISFIRRLLEAYPKVLLVTKPHLESVKAICETFIADRERILFRFTIGSADDSVLKFWEPKAPSFAERLDCLKLAHACGFGTSVSCEPMLDNNIEAVVRAVKPYVNETIWLGKANKLKQRLSLNGHKDAETMAKADQLMEWQSDANIKSLYQRLKGETKIRWKESIRKVVDR
jgi:DNA repair photolyase